MTSQRWGCHTLRKQNSAAPERKYSGNSLLGDAMPVRSGRPLDTYQTANTATHASSQRGLLNASGTTGFGLKNVHERIRLTYGPKYGLTIHSVEDEGTTVTIRIPRGWEEDRA